MSYYINKQQIAEIIVLYIRLDGGNWIKITTSDGSNIIEKLDEEPKVIYLEDIKDDFAYPIKKIETKYIGGKIECIRNYIYNNDPFELIGFYFQFNNGFGFSLIEENGCLRLFDGILVKDKYSLV